MEQKELGGKMLEVDEDGFIQDPEQWDRAVAGDIAKTEGVDEMTDDHWKVVNYLREYYLEYNMAPMIRKLCKTTGKTLLDKPAVAPVRRLPRSTSRRFARRCTRSSRSGPCSSFRLPRPSVLSSG